MSDSETQYDGDEPAPDAFDPRAECRAWIKGSRVIGGPSHTHICRMPDGHRDVQVIAPATADGSDVLSLEFELAQHQCTCGHRW